MSIAEEVPQHIAPSGERLAVPPGLGKPILGPTALGNDPRRLLRLAWTLAITDFKLKFFGSVLGYLWQVMKPLMLFGVLYAVFTTVFKVGDNIPRFPVALLLGIVMYSFFSEVTAGAVRSVVQREALVRRVEFPRLAIPLATVITGLLNLGLNLIPVLVFLIASGGQWHRSWLQLPFLIAMLGVFAFGLAMLLSALFVRARDIEPIWDVVLQALFYASGVFFPIQRITDEGLPHWVVRAVLCNPFAALLEQSRHALIDPDYPSTPAAMGGVAYLLIPIGVAVLLLVVGFFTFRHEAPRVAEDL